MSRKNLVYILLTAALFICSLFSIVLYKVKSEEILSLKSKELTKVRDQTSKRVVEFLQKKESDFGDFVNNKATKQFLTKLEKGFRVGIHSKEYDNDKKLFLEYLSLHTKQLGFRRFVFTSPSGEIIFSSDGKEVGFNIFHDILENLELSHSLMRANLARTIDFSKSEYDYDANESERYFSFPLDNGNMFLGVASCSIGIKTVNDILLSSDVIENEEEIFLYELRKNEVILISSTEATQTSFQVVSTYNPFGTTPIDLALSGQEGSGKGVVSGKEAITTFKFIPFLNWGIVTSSNLKLLFSTISYLKIMATIFFVVGFLLLLIMIWTTWKESFKALYHEKIWPMVCAFIIIIAIGVIFFQTYMIYSSHQEAIANVHKSSRERVSETIEQITQPPRDLVFTTNWLADDIEKGRLKQEDLPIRLKRDFQQIKGLERVIIAYKPPPLISVEAKRQKDAIEISALKFDYTDPSQFPTKEENWYEQAASGKREWLQPFRDRETNHLTAIYIAPFKAESEGVIVAYFDLFKFQQAVTGLGAGSNSQIFLTTYDGKIIGSNNEKIVHENALIKLNETNFKKFQKFTDKNNETFYLYLEPIPNTPWLIASVIRDRDVSTDVELLRRYYFVLITAIVFLIIAIVGLITCYFIKNGKKLLFFFPMYVAVVVVGLTTLWITIHFTTNKPTIEGLLIQDNISRDKFINTIKKEASDKFLETPIFLPTGIWISFLNIISEDKLSFSAIAWQKYPLETTLKKGLVFPQATEIKIDEMFSKTFDQYLTINWYVKADISQRRDKSSFPFDNYLMKIFIEGADVDPNVYLIPDLESYRQFAPKDKPGIASNFSIPGYNLTQTFFSLEKVPFYTNLGRDQQLKEMDRQTLCYNIFLVRQFLIPFIPFLIPLIVIQVGMYAVFLMMRKEKGLQFMPIISAYTACFFAIAILQLSLRTRYAGENILYAETFFFIGYFLVCLLYAYAILLKLARENSRIIKAKYFLNLFYWPLQLTLWYVIALVYFYH